MLEELKHVVEGTQQSLCMELPYQVVLHTLLLSSDADWQGPRFVLQLFSNESCFADPRQMHRELLDALQELWWPIMERHQKYHLNNQAFN